MKKKFDLEVLFLSPESVIPYLNNAKNHDDLQVSKIAKQIQNFGFDQPIVIDEKNVILKGHGRVLAAKKLGLKKIPCIQRSDLSEHEKIAARIGDNKVAESSYDLSLLKLDLFSLKSVEFDLDLTALKIEEIEKLLTIPSSKEVTFTVKSGATEYGEEEFKKFDHKCPKCSFEFNEK